MSKPVRAQEIDLTRLTFEQLNELKTGHEEELNQYRQNASRLEDADKRFQQNKVIIDRFTPESAGRMLLVPLTNSLFVHGRIADPSTVLVDIGTGYYVEKSAEEAKAMFDRKSDLIAQQINTIESIIKQKRRNLDMIMTVLNMKNQMAQKYLADQRNMAQSDQAAST